MAEFRSHRPNPKMHIYHIASKPHPRFTFSLNKCISKYIIHLLILHLLTETSFSDMQVEHYREGQGNVTTTRGTYPSLFKIYLSHNSTLQAKSKENGSPCAHPGSQNPGPSPHPSPQTTLLSCKAPMNTDLRSE